MTAGRPAMLWTVALGAAALALLHAALYWGAGPVDDDYIVHRYAANLVAGHGFVFNSGGEVAEGFTSPLWLLVAVALRIAGAAPADAVRVIGAAAFAALAAVLAAAGIAYRPHAGARAAWPGYVAALSPALAFHACAGLGTLPLALLLTAFAAAWLRAERRGDTPWAAGAWLALASLTRQEAALFVLPFAVALVLQPRAGHHPSCDPRDADAPGEPRAAARAARGWHHRLAPVLPAVVALVGWTLFRFAVFGRLDPVTHAVKRLPLADELEYGLHYLRAGTLDAFVGPLLVLQAFVAFDPRAPRAVRALAAGVLLHAAFVVAVGGDWMAFARFFVPAFGVALVALAAWPRPGRLARGAMAVVLALGFQQGQAQRAQVHADHRFFEERWLELGEFFGAHAAPGTRVALSPIGAFGWRSELPVIDLLGLTHTRLLDVPPDLANVRMKGHHRHAADWVLEEPPEFVLLGNGVLQPDTGRLDVNPWERSLVLDPRFAASYVQSRTEVAGTPTQWFRRRDVPPLPGEQDRSR